MLNGNAWIHHGWNGDIVNVRNQADDPSIYKFEKCKEGIPVGADQMAIPANAEHPGTAMLFIDFMLDPENAAQNVAYFGYPMPNDGAVDAFQKLAKDDPAINVTTEDLESGDQFAASGGRAPPGLGPRLDRGQGGLSEQRFAAALLRPGRCGWSCCSRSRSASRSPSRSGRPTTSATRSTAGTPRTTSRRSTRCSSRCCCARWASRSPRWGSAW